jgi:cellobiose phosphorylase
MKSRIKIQENGRFVIENADLLSYTYFPLTNFHSVKSAITPKLSGSMAIDQNTFFLAPTSNEDSHASLFNRNMFFKVNDEFVWSITGNTAFQTLNKDHVTLVGDFLSQEMIRENMYFRCSIESFVPLNNTYQELHKVTIISQKDGLKLKPVVGVPLYNRSADNLRDHRHVTSLLNKAVIVENGIINTPTFSFDERGHMVNKMNYGVFVNSDLTIKNRWPLLEEFIGDGGNLFNPKVVEWEMHSKHSVGETVSGYELIAGLEYETIILNKGESKTFVMSFVMDEELEKVQEISQSLSIDYYQSALLDMKQGWQKELQNLQFHYPNKELNGWLKWTTLQPILRRIYGNSFLPHHDYGRGGKGWRDLWQDALALILLDPKDVKEMLLNNFIGVRIDGSNATIIGDKLGEFKADRNNISRVWMDHGSWPFLTVKFYIDQSGDDLFLLENQKYFEDQFIHYTKQTKEYNGKDNILKTTNNEVYTGSIIEHIIIQNIVPFFNVGDHNNIRLEDADWNDGLDMAHDKGESVAFTSLYGYNLVELAHTLEHLYGKGIKELSLLKELRALIEFQQFDDIVEKRKTLETYFTNVEDSISGETDTYDTLELSTLLKEKGTYLLRHVRDNEWLESDGLSWFNGYYDNDGERVEDTTLNRMTLTGQVFAIYGGSATREQILKIIESADALLFEETVGGYRLNTDFNEVKTNLGRMFGFAYGHKENGAMFSHMAVMYANALYKRGFAHEGYKVINTIYKHVSCIETAKMYPGIPEYVDVRGRGMYPYLTGSASWLILAEVNEIFGIKGRFGSLLLEPKLVLEQFEDTDVSITTLIKNKLVQVTYQNKQQLDYNEYKIKEVWDGNKKLSFAKTEQGVLLLDEINSNHVVVVLDKK